jgi:hypothetical protein
MYQVLCETWKRWPWKPKKMLKSDLKKALSTTQDNSSGLLILKRAEFLSKVDPHSAAPITAQ